MCLPWLLAVDPFCSEPISASSLGFTSPPGRGLSLAPKLSLSIPIASALGSFGRYLGRTECTLSLLGAAAIGFPEARSECIIFVVGLGQR